MKLIFNSLIGFYQTVISPLIGQNCRYAPSCSEYAKQAIELHGSLKGGYLACKRIARCHPWGGYGFDPVPGSSRDSLDASTNNYSNENGGAPDKCCSEKH